MIVAAAGVLFQSDSFDATLPIGPESLQREEVDVDIGRGAWLIRTDLARTVPNFPQLGSALSTSIHVAAAMQHAGASTVVLPYPHNQPGVWGMLETAKQPGSMSARFDRESQQGRGPNAEAMRRADYDVYRHGAAWEPLCVMATQAEEDTVAQSVAEEEPDAS